MIQEVVRLTGAKRCGDGWLGKCPAHDDSTASLSIAEGAGGKLLAKCHAGCSWADIRDALERKGLQMETEPAETVWTAYGTDRKPKAEHVRIDIPLGKKIFWRGLNGEKHSGIRLAELPPYAWERVRGSKVFVCEGEKAADALMRLGLEAVGTFGADVCPNSDALAFLKNRIAILWPDNDDPGRKHMAAIQASLEKLDIDSVTLTWTAAQPKGDAADFVLRGGKVEDVWALVAQASKPRLPTLADGCRSAVEEMDRYEAADFSDRVQTGISKLDRRLRGGLRAGQVTLLGAPTGGGKTTLAQQIAAHAARKGPVLFVTPEMSVEELAEREIIRRSGTELWERNPWISSAEQKDLARIRHQEARVEIGTLALPLYVLDRSDATMMDVEDEAGKIKGLVLVVIDYAQQVADVMDQKRPRYLQVGDVGTRSVALAMRLHVPVLIASQVNVIKDGNSRSFAFRETAILEHKAHNVIIFDVEWSEPAVGDEGGLRTVKRAMLHCTKQRSGSAFKLEVQYDPGLYRVSEKERERDYRIPAQLPSLPYAD